MKWKCSLTMSKIVIHLLQYDILIHLYYFFKIFFIDILLDIILSLSFVFYLNLWRQTLQLELLSHFEKNILYIFKTLLKFFCFSFFFMILLLYIYTDFLSDKVNTPKISLFLSINNSTSLQITSWLQIPILDILNS